MAILKGIATKMNGSAGSFTFKTKSGHRTIVSEKISSTTDAKTEPQQAQRMKWSNVIRMYQVLRPYMLQAYGGSQNGRSDYNKFVGSNLSTYPVYLSKQEANLGACVVAPYYVTQGKMNSIVVTGKGKDAITDISLGKLQINANTTVADFSFAVVENNPDYNFDHQITYFLVTQSINGVTGTPVARVETCKVVLSKSDSAKLLSVVDPRAFASRNGFLGAKADAEFGNHGMCWVHSKRAYNGATQITSQILIVENEVLSNYCSVDAYESAVKSYGGSKSAYLSPSSGLVSVGATDSGSAPSTPEPSVPGGSTDSGSDAGSGGSAGGDTGGGLNPDDESGYQ